MNLSEALSELKNKKTQLSRLIAIREQTIKYNTQQPEPEKKFDQLTKEIKKLAEEATFLKNAIATTNTTTITVLENQTYNLNTLILQQGDLRSEIAALKKMLGTNQRGRFDTTIFDVGYGEDKIKFQKTRFEIEEQVRVLEKQKRRIDAIIQKTNWTTNIKE